MADSEKSTEKSKRIGGKSLEDLIQDYESFETTTNPWRERAQRDRDYRDGIQWTSEERAKLAKRKQPCLTFNRIGPKIDFIVGTEIKSRTDPKALPRTPAESKSADAVTDAIRYVADDDQTDTQGKLTKVAEDLFVEGYGGVHISTEVCNDEVKIVLDAIPWDRIYYDPKSRRPDFSDSRYFGEVVWMDYDQAVALWPDAEDVLDDSVGDGSDGSQTFDDTPRNTAWSDGKRQRVKICHQYWVNKERINGEIADVWYSAKFNNRGFIEEPIKVPFVDEYDRNFCCIVLTSSSVTRDGERYGAVRNLIDPQDEINHRRSKGLHFGTMRQVAITRKAVDDPDKLRTELAKPDGLILVNGVIGQDMQVLSTNDMQATHLQLLQEAKSEIDAIGPNAALTGSDPRALSGRAIMAKQQSGYAELEKYFEAMRKLKRRVYKIYWWIIRKSWTAEKWIRVTDDAENLRFVPLNQPITKRMIFESQIEEAERAGEPMDPQIIQQMMLDPTMDEVVEIRNDLATLGVDIIIDESPDVVALQQEQFETLSGLAEKGLPIPPEAIVNASSLRNKKQILDAMKNGGQQPPTPEQQQQMQQQQQMAMQMQQVAMQKEAAEVDETNASAMQKRASAEETQVDTQIKLGQARAGMMQPSPAPPA